MFQDRLKRSSTNRIRRRVTYNKNLQAVNHVHPDSIP